MENKQALAILKNFNEWRRGGEGRQPEPHLIGLAIDKGIEALDLSTEHAKMVEMLEEARTTISRLKLSMLVHPDCTNGSEFDDRTTDAQKIEEEISTLLSSIKKGGSDE